MGLIKKFLKLTKIPQEWFEQPRFWWGSDTWIRERGVSNYLMRWNSNLKKDATWNLYLLKENTILLCAHMDTVWSAEAQMNVHNIKLIDGVISWTHNIGADDKCGIAIAMELYEKHPERFSLLFTVGEESWGLWSSDFVEEFGEQLKKLNYCIIADRKGSKDIIWFYNDYCTMDFSTIVSDILINYWYSETIGVYSDADNLNEYINCINLSCWYYNAHTNDEFVIVSEFENCLNAIEYLTEKYNERLAPPTFKYTYRGSRGYDYSYMQWQWNSQQKKKSIPCYVRSDKLEVTETMIIINNIKIRNLCSLQLWISLYRGIQFKIIDI